MIHPVAEQAAAALGIVPLRVVDLQLQLFGQEGVAVDLPVRVGHGHAHDVAAVFEDKDVFDLFVRAQGIIALRPQIDELFDVCGRQLRQGDGVLRRVQDHLALAVARRGGEKVVRDVVRLRRILRQGGEIVIVLVNVEVIRHLAAAGAERAVVLGHLRAVLPVRRDHDPVVREEVFA